MVAEVLNFSEKSIYEDNLSSKRVETLADGAIEHSAEQAYYVSITPGSTVK